MAATTAEKSSVSLLDRIRIFFSQVQTEMSKVSWPTKDQVKTYTVVVILATIVIGAIMAVWDLAVSKVLQILFLFGG